MNKRKITMTQAAFTVMVLPLMERNSKAVVDMMESLSDNTQKMDECIEQYLFMTAGHIHTFLESTKKRLTPEQFMQLENNINELMAIGSQEFMKRHYEGMENYK